MGRGDRTWDFWEVDFSFGLRRAFTLDEVGWLPTRVEVGVGYLYEYHPPRTHIHDTQFWLADVALPDLWLVPCLSYERDVIRDNGTYLNLSLSKEIEVGGGVSLVPSVAQGWGDRKRVAGYLSAPDLVGRLERAALMDTRVGLSLAWRVTDCLTFSGFVAYSDHFLPGVEPLYNSTITNWYLRCLVVNKGKIPENAIDSNVRTDVAWIRLLAGGSAEAPASIRKYVERGEGESAERSGLAAKFGRVKSHDGLSSRLAHQRLAVGSARGNLRRPST